MPDFPNVYKDHLDLAQPQAEVRAPGATAEAFGAESAASLGNVGKGLEAVSRAAYTIDDHLNEANVGELDNQYVEFERKRKAEFYAKQGRNALEDRQPFEADLRAHAEYLTKSARSGEANAALQKLINNRLNDTLSSADNYNRGQLNEYLNDTSKARIEQASQSVAGSFHDPAAVARNIGLIDGESDAVAERQGMSPETTAEFKRQNRANAYIEGFQVAVATDPYGVKKQLTSKDGYGADLDADKRAALIRLADNEIERRQAKAEAGYRQSVSMVKEMVKLGIPPPPNSPSVKEVAAHLGGAEALDYEIALGSYQQHQILFAAPNSVVDQVRAEPDIQPRGIQDYEEVMLQRSRKKAADEIHDQRTTDGMGYLIGRGLIDDAPHALAARGASVIGAAQAGDWTTLGTILLSRKAALETTGAKLGMGNTGPLTNDEASAIGAAVHKLPADAQSAVLGQIAKNMGGGKVYSSFARQIGQATNDNIGYGGYLVNMGRGGRTVAGDIDGAKASKYVLHGQALLDPRDEEGKPAKGAKFEIPGDAALDAAWTAYVGGGRGDKPSAYAMSPDVEAKAKQAFRAAYAGLASEKGYTDAKHVNTDLATKAAEIATGGVGLVGMGKTVLPWGMTNGTFMSSLRAHWGTIAKDNALVGTNPESWSYVIMADGSGRYRVMRGNSIARDKKGQPVYIKVGADQ